MMILSVQYLQWWLWICALCLIMVMNMCNISNDDCEHSIDGNSTDVCFILELNYKRRSFPPSKCAMCQTSHPPPPLSNYTRPSLKSFHCGYKYYLCMTQVLHKSPDRNHTHSEEHCCQRKFKVCAIGDLANGSLIQAPLTEIFGEKFALVLHYSRVPWYSSTTAEQINQH